MYCRAHSHSQPMSHAPQPLPVTQNSSASPRAFRWAPIAAPLALFCAQGIILLVRGVKKKCFFFRCEGKSQRSQRGRDGRPIAQTRGGAAHLGQWEGLGRVRGRLVVRVCPFTVGDVIISDASTDVTGSYKKFGIFFIEPRLRSTPIFRVPSGTAQPERLSARPAGELSLWAVPTQKSPNIIFWCCVVGAVPCSLVSWRVPVCRSVFRVLP